RACRDADVRRHGRPGAVLMRCYVVLFCGIVLAACAGHPDATVCSTGIICPAGTQCAAAQPVCITNNCGNAKIDPGETCDDGNILDGDGCAHDCLSSEECGDHVVNTAAGEVCDDGNTMGGDGCSADCRSNEICGNGGEAAACNLDCTTSVCGDGKLNTHAGELCDDHNTTDGDGCEHDCTLPSCGNGIMDSGEACDDGNAIEGDACDTNCTLPACGNAIKDPTEGCDDGNMINGDGCDNNCKPSGCGNGATG